MSDFLNWVTKETSMNLISSIIIMIATVSLAILTGFYLWETNKQRKLMEKSVLVDTSPKLFIKTIKPELKLKTDVNEFLIENSIVFTNCGKTEAKNIKWTYVLINDDHEKLGAVKGPYQYLFPNQTASYELEAFRISVNKEQMRAAKEQMKTVMETIRPEEKLNLRIAGIKPINLGIKLEYQDMEDKKIEYFYGYEYLFSKGTWSPKDTNECIALKRILESKLISAQN